MNKINKYIILYFCFTIHLKLIIELMRMVKILINKSIEKKKVLNKIKKIYYRYHRKKISKLKDKDV